MTQYELLKMAEPILTKMLDSGIGITDVRNLQVFEEYERMKKEGHKMSYIVSYLGSEYKLTERAVHYLIKRMKKNV